MSKCSFVSAVAVAAAVLGTTVVAGSPVLAADIPVKAVKATPPAPLDVHGYADLTIANTRVTPGGSVIYPYRGTLAQVETGLSLDLYKDPTGFINKWSVYGGVWNEYWSGAAAGSWQEMDWWLGTSVSFAQKWTFSYTYLEFKLPGGPSAYNSVFSLNYADGGFGVLPFPLNPFVNVLVNHGGFNLVATGSNSYRVELGIKPTVSLDKSAGIPLSFTFPTYVTLAPKAYWNSGSNLCGGVSCSDGAAGVFSTGIQAKYMLTAVIPPRLGAWYLKAGVQWHHLFNDSLLAAQVNYGSATTYADAKRDWAVVTGGIGFSF